MENSARFSSSEGVTFEMKPHANPSAIPAVDNRNNNTTDAERSPAVRSDKFRIPWDFARNTSRTFRSTVQRRMSQASGHVCDLESHYEEEQEDDKDDDDVSLEYYLEEGKTKRGDEKHDEREEKATIAWSASERNAKQQRQQDKPSVPGKRDSRLSIILLDQRMFTVYKRLFVVCLALNISGLALAATGNFPYARNRAALFSIANILGLTLCRSEAFLRIVFYLTVKLLGRSLVHLWVKTADTSLLQSLGGIHSGCGVSSIAWLIYALILTLKHRDNTPTEYWKLI